MLGGPHTFNVILEDNMVGGLVERLGGEPAPVTQSFFPGP